MIFNQILGELRLDIREQVRRAGRRAARQVDGQVDRQVGELLLCSCAPQVKELALIRNTILECQVCGESADPDGSFLASPAI